MECAGSTPRNVSSKTFVENRQEWEEREVPSGVGEYLPGGLGGATRLNSPRSAIRGLQCFYLG